MIDFAQPARKIPASLPEPERDPLIGELSEDEFDPPAARPYHASRCRPRLTDRVVERRPEELPIAARSKRRLPRPRCRDATASRNRQFESTPLQRRVCKPSVPQRPEPINACVVIGIVCFLGLTALLLVVIPLVAILPILLFIGLVIGAQAFQATPARRPPAIILAILPNVAA